MTLNGTTTTGAQFRVDRVTIATGERETVVQTNDGPEFLTIAWRDLLQPGAYVQFVCLDADTTRRYLPADCPHAQGHITNAVTVRRYLSRYVSGGLPGALALGGWDCVADFMCDADEECSNEVNEPPDERWWFNCAQCGEEIELHQDPETGALARTDQ